MDELIAILYSALPVINIIALLIIGFKFYLFFKSRTRSIQQLILSFFQIYPRHEIEISDNPIKRKLMWTSNGLNFALYVVIVLNLFFYFVIKK
jgi:hypothetical protein